MRGGGGVELIIIVKKKFKKIHKNYIEKNKKR